MTSSILKKKTWTITAKQNGADSKRSARIPRLKKKTKTRNNNKKAKSIEKNIKTKRVWIQEYYEGERIAAVNVVVGPLTAS